MKLSNKKKMSAKLFVTLATVAAMTAAFTVVASADGGGTGAEAAYQSTIEFFITWIRRIGMMVAFVGAVMFGLAIKNNDADQKQSGLITMVAGFVVAALCAASSMFDLFT